MPPMPFMVAPQKAKHSNPKQEYPLEPLQIDTVEVISSVLDRDLPSWSHHATALFSAFSKRSVQHMMGYMGGYGSGGFLDNRGGMLGNENAPFMGGNMPGAYPSNVPGAYPQRP